LAPQFRGKSIENTGWSSYPKKLTGFPMDSLHPFLTLLTDSKPIESTFRSVETKSMLDGDLLGIHARIEIIITPSGLLS
jgi:hypothetical protein